MKLTTKLKIKEERYDSLKNALVEYKFEDSQTRRGELIFAISEAWGEAETGRSIPILAFGMESLFSRNGIIASAQEALFHLDRKIRMEKGLPVEPLREPPKTSATDKKPPEEAGMNEVKENIQGFRILGMMLSALIFFFCAVTYGSRDIGHPDGVMGMAVLIFISCAFLRRKWIDQITRERLMKGLMKGLMVARWGGVFLAVATIPHAKSMGYDYSDVTWKAIISAAMLVPRFQILCERMTDGKMVGAFRFLYWVLLAFFGYGVLKFIFSHGIA